jgi:hypothetical protein
MCRDFYIFKYVNEVMLGYDVSLNMTDKTEMKFIQGFSGIPTNPKLPVYWYPHSCFRDKNDQRNG